MKETATKIKMPAIIPASQLENGFFEDVYGAINMVKSTYADYQSAPTKPYLSKNHTSKEAADYAKALAAYDKEYELYKKERTKAQKHNADANEQLEIYMKEVSGLNRIVPKDKQSKVWSKAWEDGHSNGYGEVYGHLSSLVDLFA